MTTEKNREDLSLNELRKALERATELSEVDDDEVGEWWQIYEMLAELQGLIETLPRKSPRP